MAMVRCVTEMGMGVDVHGLDYTKAATRAVFDAIHHSSLGFQRMLGKTADDMTVTVTIGASKPDQVDTAAVAATLPHGTATCTAVMGGLEIPSADGNDGLLIANAVIIVSFDDGK
ncbi:MAG: Lin0512 family protein [Chloroflexi bacterium]|nr:Lin0512 family protein [Chloroflexota bacterium]MDA1271234.1 Lin0512 family protein [Chloroflexota bacterium]